LLGIPPLFFFTGKERKKKKISKNPLIAIKYQKRFPQICNIKRIPELQKSKQYFTEYVKIFVSKKDS